VPAFDPNHPRSPEGAALYHMADLLSECDNFQTLTETDDSLAALEKVVIGYHNEPWDSDQYSVDELASLFCEAHLISSLEGERAVVRSDSSPTPEEGGTWDMSIRRYVRDSEKTDRSGLYLWFLDVVAALETEIITNADVRECPRLISISRDQGPAFGVRDAETAQGDYLWVTHTIAWGDPVGE